MRKHSPYIHSGFVRRFFVQVRFVYKWQAKAARLRFDAKFIVLQEIILLGHAPCRIL